MSLDLSLTHKNMVMLRPLASWAVLARVLARVLVRLNNTAVNLKSILMLPCNTQTFCRHRGLNVMV